MQLLQYFKDLTLHPKNAKELKGLILQLAIQGKLTANWRKDNPDLEPAEDLMKLITKARKDLILEKKVKDFGDFKPLNQLRQLHNLPEKWIWCRLGDITDLPYGKGLTSTELLEEGYDVFGANGIIGKYHSYLYEDNMLLISCRGAYSGKTNISPKKCFVTSNSLVCEFFNPTATNFKYYYYAISAIPTGLIVTGSAQPQVTATNARELALPLPPVEEQKEIVRVVEILFNEVEQLKQLTKERIALKEDFVSSALRQLTTENTETEWNYLQNHFKPFFTEKSSIKKLREAVLQLAVQGKLTVDWRKSNPDTEPATELLKRIQKEKAQLIKDKKIKKESPLPPISDDEVPYELPESWVWCRLAEITILITDGKHGNCEDESNSGYYFLSAKDVQNGKLIYNYARQINFKEFQEVHQRTNLEVGDLCIVNTGATVGKSAIVIDDEKTRKTTFQKSVAVVKVLHNYIDIEYVDNFIKEQTPKLLKKSGGSAINNLLLGDMKKIITPLPPIDEQKAIVEKVNALMLLCDQLEQEIEESKNLNEQLMKSVLREVFSENKKELENV